jgi:hypothetical protein
VQGGGTLQQVPQADLKFYIVRAAFADVKVINGSFSVQWNGLLNAPQSGDYTFFISPININAGHKWDPVKFRMTVSVAGQMLLESTPDQSGTPFPGYQPGAKPQEWTSQSQPVTLTAGQPVALQVTVTAEVNRGLPTSILHAMLYWQGPGVPKSLVPTSNLTLPNGSGPGLQATYSWRFQGQPQSLTRTDPMIDFAWANSYILLSQDMTVPNQAADEMWQAMTSANFVATLVGPPVSLHPFFFKDPDDVSTGLTTARREGFLALLLKNPTLLDVLDAKWAVRSYEDFRLGTPGPALDVFGTWAARHADMTCEIANESAFDGDNRAALSDMASHTTLQLPEQAGRLQNEFLQLPDGRCALPVAYTLSYSYLGRRKMADWIAFLDAKLADPTLVGDVRVNWLLARAHAQELVRNPSKHYPQRWPFPANWPLDGRKYLDQALQAAQSPQVKIRVAREIIGRLAAAGRFQEATDLLQQLSNSLPNAQKAIAAGWQQMLAEFAAYQQRQPSRAKQAYLKTLQSRLSQASSRGDTAEAARYTALINAIQNRP